jgi:hypothetical protein
MTKVIVDPVTEAKLAATRKTLEICNDRGRVLGHFVPNLNPGEVSMEPQISQEELDRRERAGGGRPLVDILADLEKRA